MDAVVVSAKTEVGVGCAAPLLSEALANCAQRDRDGHIQPRDALNRRLLTTLAT